MEFKRYKINPLGQSFQLMEVVLVRDKVIKEVRSAEIFRGGILECEAYIRLLKDGYIM
jgi:hypothetical protein